MPSKTQSFNLCKQVLQCCGTDQAEVTLLVEEEALTRFANNAIHQNVAQSDATLIVRLFVGQRSGMASTNQTDPVALDELVARARMIAQASPPDPEAPGPAEPATYAPVDSFDDFTAEYSPEQRAEQVSIACRLAAKKHLNASGALSTGYSEIAIANSRGLFAYHASTQADFQTVIMGEDSSGRAQASGWQVAEIAVEELSREAIAKAAGGLEPRAITPGEYPVILDPYATEDLLNMLNYNGMGGLTVMDGRSWMNDRIGMQVMSPLVSIWDDGRDSTGLPLPFDYEGVPKRRVEIVSRGVVKGPVYDRYTAHKAGSVSTGHALPPNLPSWMRGAGPLALNLFMAPGEASLEEMIRSTERGLYITSFWYTRLVHPRDCLVTGMTRDGVFLIEKGEIAHPVKNLRFTQSYVQALAGVEAVGKETRLLKIEYGSRALRVPTLKLSRFNFTGVTV